MADDADDQWRRERTLRDQRFLKDLHRAGPLPFQELAEKIGRAPRTEDKSLGRKLSQLVGAPKVDGSKQARWLEQDGAILGYRAVVDTRRIDLGQITFVQVALRDMSSETLDAFAAAVQAMPEIETCHMIAGDFHYLLQVRTENVKAFRHILTDKIATLPAVARTAVIVALDTVKEG